MKRRSWIFAFLIFVPACGGKLEGATMGLDSGVNQDDGAACAPFVGTWTCNMTTTMTPVPPGSSSPFTSVVHFTFEGDDGGLLVTFGGTGEGPTCTSIRLSVSGASATVDGQQTCDVYDYSDTVTSGTLSASGCAGGTITNLTANVVSGNTSFTSTASGTCTN